MNAAVFAKQVVYAHRPELIVCKIVFSGKQSEIVGFDNNTPVTRLGTNRAVAFARSRTQVDVGFVPYSPAMATSLICFFHDKSPVFLSKRFKKNCPTPPFTAVIIVCRVHILLFADFPSRFLCIPDTSVRFGYLFQRTVSLTNRFCLIALKSALLKTSPWLIQSTTFQSLFLSLFLV
jgi:hypothetical protein